MKKIRLTEAELNQMISETIKQVLKEGFMDNMKAGFQGFKSGYKNSQLQSKCNKILDLGNELANELYSMNLKDSANIVRQAIYQIGTEVGKYTQNNQ